MPSAVATSWACTVVVPLPNSAVPTRQRVDRRRGQPRPTRRRSARGAAWWRSSPAPCPRRRASCARRRRRRPVSLASARLRPGRGTGRGRSCRRSGRRARTWASTTNGSPGTTTLRRRNSNGSMPSCRASSSSADSIGEDHLPQAVPAERARRQVVRVDRLGVHALVRRSGTPPPTRRSRGTSRPARGCRTRRCRSARRRASAVSTPSASRRSRHVDPHRVPARRDGELVGAGELVAAPARRCRSTASATRSSVSISCLPPKPPPTRAVNTRTSLASSPKTWHSSSRTRNGTCELVRITKRAVGHPASRCSRASPGARAGRGRCSTGPAPPRAPRRRPAVTSPTPPCNSATTLRDGSAIRASDALSPCTRGARVPARPRGRTPRAAPRTRPAIARQAFSAIARLSATTAATRCPTKRTTSSSTWVSSGSSSRSLVAGGRERHRRGCRGGSAPARTPGMPGAAVVSIETMRACGMRAAAARPGAAGPAARSPWCTARSR